MIFTGKNKEIERLTYERDCYKDCYIKAMKRHSLFFAIGYSLGALNALIYLLI